MSENTLKVKIKQRYDTEANWSSSNPVLLSGEMAISSDKNGKYKVGDGTKKWTELSYAKANLSKDDIVQALGYTPPSSLSSLGITATATELNYMDGVTSNVQTQLNGKASSSHTHNYAGSSSAGGSATSANKLNATQLTNQNLNNYHSGVNFYYAGGGNTCTNKPSGVDNFGMFVFQTAGGWFTQLLYGSDDDIYTRRWVNDSWTAWSKFYTTTNKPTASEIGAAATSHGTHVTYGTTAPKANGTASAGTASSVSRSDHVHPLQTTISGNAGSATKLATARTIDGVSFNGTANIIHYGTCSTAAGTAAKTVSLTGFTLATGSIVTVKFTVTNTASSPTLNVNGTGAKAIQYRGAAISAGYLAANRVYTFIYDGTNYQLIGDINTDTNTTYGTGNANTAGLTKLYTATGSATDGTMTQKAITDALGGKASSSHTHNYAGSSSAGGAANSAVKLNTARNINGTAFDGTKNITLSAMYAEDLSNKEVSLNTYNLSSGSPKVKYYFCPSDGAGDSITGRPDDGQKYAFFLICESIRFASTSDYISKQTYIQGNNKTTWERYCTNGTWSAWGKRYTSQNKPTASEIGAASSSHAHNYAGSSSAGGAANSVKSALTIQFNGSTKSTFNGSAAATVNITPAAIGAATSGHTHSLSSFGITATASELNYVDGVTSNIQTQFNNKANKTHQHLLVQKAEPTTQNVGDFWFIQD